MDPQPRELGLRRGGRAQLSFRALSARHLGELVAELAPLLARARLKDVHALPPRDALLVFEALPEQGQLAENSEPSEPDHPKLEETSVQRLRLSADPEGPRLHLQFARVRRAPGPAGPFYRNLKRELEGSRLSELSQLNQDRVVRLSFEGGAQGSDRALVLELFGRRANLILLDAEGRILDLLEPPKSRGSGERLELGSPWSAPSGANPGTEGEGLAELAARERSASGEPEPEAQPLALTRGAQRLAERAPLSLFVEEHLGERARLALLERSAKQLCARLERKLARARKQLEGLAKKRAAAQEADRLRMDGELLKAELGRLRRGLDSVEVQDWFSPDAAARTIALDPKLAPRENVERIFARYRKLQRSAANVEGEIERAKDRRLELERMLERARGPEADPFELELEARQRGLLEALQVADPRRRPAPTPRSPYRTFAGTRGSQIRVGKSAADNDQLTFRHAAGNDLWLHTADAPGSHVVLRLAKGAEPDPEELLDAAHLAAHFSPLKDARRVSVHVARRKQVKKPRRAKPGLVSVAGGRILELVVQPERLARLLGRGRSGTSAGP